jgi:flagellar hook protein FlgE
MTSAMGLRLQGFQAVDGVIQPQVGDLKVELGHISSKASESITLSANINADADSSTSPLSGYSLDGLTETIVDVAADADFATSVSIYDSLGAKHDLTLAFEKTGTNTWSCHVLADGAEIEDANNTGATLDGYAFQIDKIDLVFDSNGDITSYSQTDTYTTNNWTFIGANPISNFDSNGVQQTGIMNYDFGQDSDGAGGLSQLASHSTVTSLDQNGYTVGHLTSLQILTNGNIQGKYDNGQDITLGQVVIAQFDTTSGLERTGSNSFRATRIPGEPTVGRPGEGGRGDIFGSSLEASNVDIEDEFVNMITAQRSYQANSRVMSATNELLRELVNLV